MKKILRNSLFLFGIMIMLNSCAVWAFSFISCRELILIYVANLVPFIILFCVGYIYLRLGRTKLVFVFLYFIFVKLFIFLVFLYLYNRIYGITPAFMLNFVIVYIFFLFQSIFITTKFLIKK